MLRIYVGFPCEVLFELLDYVGVLVNQGRRQSLRGCKLPVHCDNTIHSFGVFTDCDLLFSHKLLGSFKNFMALQSVIIGAGVFPFHVCFGHENTELNFVAFVLWSNSLDSCI